MGFLIKLGLSLLVSFVHATPCHKNTWFAATRKFDKKVLDACLKGESNIPPDQLMCVGGQT